MVQIREGAAIVTPNRTQSIVKIVNANVTYVTTPRAGGKTWMIGDRIDQLNDAMPRSQILLFSDTFKRLEERIVPNILSYFINEAGMIEGEDFVCYKKPPEHWIKPLIPLKDFDHVISFSSGMALCLASQMVPGSANAYNAQALIVDEAKYIQEVVINTEVLPALRGAEAYFGHLPEYRSHWYFTDKYGENIKWILAKKKVSNDKLAQAIIKKQTKVFELYNKLEAVSSTSTKQPLIDQITELEATLQRLRRSLVYYHDARPYENIDKLGKKYFRDLKRDLTKYEYSISVENEDPTRVQSTFYPALSGIKHYHKYMLDTTEQQDLIVSMDYQWKITPMVIGTFSELPGKPGLTYNIVNGVHSLHPEGGIEVTVDNFNDYYKHRTNRVIYYVYDHTATGKRPDGRCFKDIAIERFELHGWLVIEKHMGTAPDHDLKFQEFIKAFNADKMMVNEVRAANVLLSVENASAVTSGKITKKDKSQEKKLNNPVEQTDYSDALDMQAFAVLVQELITPARNTFTGDIIFGR